MSDDEFERYVVMEPRRMIESSSDRDEAVSIASAWKNPCCVLDAHEFRVIYRNDAVEEDREWTVIGHYDDTGQTFCDTVVATDELAAAAAVVESMIGDSDGDAGGYGVDNLVIDGVIRGAHQLLGVANSGQGVYGDDVLALRLGNEFNGEL